MKAVSFIITLFLSFPTLAKESQHRWMGIERGIMEGISLHVAPWKLDLAVGYGMGFPISESQTSSIPSLNYTSTNDMTQVTFRLGLYSNSYGLSSFYVNAIGGQITVKQKRTGQSLPDREGETTGNFLVYGLGYHWFWENFNVRLGLGFGSSNYNYIKLKDSSGNIVQTTEPFTMDVSKMGWLDLAIGWAFF